MLYIASDHRGFALKKHLVKYIEAELKQPIEDLGAKKLDPADDAPDFAIALSKKIAVGKNNLGILICWTGHAMGITANKIPGTRAITGYSTEGAEMGRLHNDANIICLASKYLSPDHAEAIVKKFLETKFDGDERLVRRNAKIAELDKK
ncbi:MAG: RpiB/LacA/LacB family sugar-phosphate isomerase [Candidatus Magasanikbacteria bacterium]|jgi:ribose 5-phosphate isomerase B